jgi:4-aminobutyrate aminotransferase
MSLMINHTEGESNTSKARKGWIHKSIGSQSAPLLARDSEAFLH